MPPITIGLPVYNEERFIGQTLQSLLEQTYQDFQLIVADNGSTDQTANICQAFAKQDSRIQFHQHTSNLGASKNFCYVLQAANSPFFLWAGSHDLWTSNYLEMLHTSLNENPQAVLAYGKTTIVDGEGNTTIAETPDQIDFTDSNPIERARKVVSQLTWCNVIYGMHRTTTLKSCRFPIPCIGSDHVLLMEIALRGKITFNPSTTFIRREYRPDSVSAIEYRREQLVRVLGRTNVTHELQSCYTKWWHEHIKSAFRVEGNLFVRIWRTCRISDAFVSRWHDRIENKHFVRPYTFIRRIIRYLSLSRRSAVTKPLSDLRR